MSDQNQLNIILIGNSFRWRMSEEQIQIGVEVVVASLCLQFACLDDHLRAIFFFTNQVS